MTCHRYGFGVRYRKLGLGEARMTTTVDGAVARKTARKAKGDGHLRRAEIQEPHAVAALLINRNKKRILSQFGVSYIPNSRPSDLTHA